MIAQSAPPAAFRLPLGRGRALSLTPGRPLLMGIVNVTPDSFSDGGLYLSPERAVEQALRLVDEGADLIDLGAESTRPPGATYGSGASAVAASEELARLLPVLAGLRRQSSVPVSIDTRKAPVARATLDAGADLLNDVSALEDPETAALVASSGCAVVLMHHHGIFAAAPRRPAEAASEAVVESVRSGLAGLVQRALDAGCRLEQLVLDPGLGFGKLGGQNLELLRRLPELASLGRPMLVGASRKSFLGGLDGPTGGSARASEPPAARLEQSLAAAAWATAGGAAILRVHDVGATRKFLAAWSAIESAGAGRPG